MGEFISGVFLACILVGTLHAMHKHIRARQRYEAYCMCAIHYNQVEPANFEDFCRYEHINGRFTGPVWAASLDVFRGAVK